MIDRKIFFDIVRKAPFGGMLRKAQVEGCNYILDEWQRRQLSDLRWLAYVMATVFHETGATMQPVREIGLGRGRDYGAIDRQTGHAYYGRGYVQLTWKRNYAVMGDRLGLDLVANPDLALRPEAALPILFDGMIEGLFTGKALPDYFSPARADWTGARAIVNGTDKAGRIAEQARQFHGALLNAERQGGGMLATLLRRIAGAFNLWSGRKVLS